MKILNILRIKYDAIEIATNEQQSE